MSTQSKLDECTPGYKNVYILCADLDKYKIDRYTKRMQGAYVMTADNYITHPGGVYNGQGYLSAIYLRKGSVFRIQRNTPPNAIWLLGIEEVRLLESKEKKRGVILR